MNFALGGVVNGKPHEKPEPDTPKFDQRFTCGLSLTVPHVYGSDVANDRTCNFALAEAMAELMINQTELADALNIELGRLTGRPGNLTYEDIGRWLRGGTRWPHERHRICLERVFNRSPEQLGFIRPGKQPAQPQKGDVVLRRTFLNGATSVVATLALTSGGAIGVGDVERIRSEYVSILAKESLRGGQKAVEDSSISFADHVQAILDHRSSTSAVRRRLYALAAGAICTGAFAALDAKAPERSRSYVDRAVKLATLSRDASVRFMTWNHLAVTAAQLHNFREALDAAKEAQKTSLARNNPRFASLAGMRVAYNQARMSDSAGAQRTLVRAEAAFEKGADRECPPWARFYDRSELQGLTATTLLLLGQPENAEAQLHQTLAGLNPELVRNKAYYTSHLALAQVRQGELDLGCDTADRAWRLAQEVPGSRRTMDALREARHHMAASRTHTPRVRDWLEKTQACA